MSSQMAIFASQSEKNRDKYEILGDCKKTEKERLLHREGGK